MRKRRKLRALRHDMPHREIFILLRLEHVDLGGAAAAGDAGARVVRAGAGARGETLSGEPGEGVVVHCA